MHQYNGSSLVIKYGGHAMTDKDMQISFASDIALLQKVGSKPVVVHGGGPQIEQMLKKLNEKELVEYNKAGVTLTESGENVGSNMMRNSRLLEVLMDSALKVEIDEEMVCGIEHHMNKQFTDALCTMLNHPRKCPHSHKIPKGECCEKN